MAAQRSSRAIVGPLGRGGSGGCVARHRAIVSANDSPDKAIGLGGGTFGPGATASFARPVGRTGAIALASSAGAANGALATTAEGCSWSCLVFAPRAFGLNHRRNVSSDSSIPSPRNPALITAIDSPLRRSFRSSLRWGSSWSVWGFFGQRACATSSVRVGFVVGVIPEWSGGEVGVMGERYSERSRDATGGHLPASKPPGLDVGVFPHYFAFILVIWCSSFWDWLSGWLIGLVDLWVLSFGSLIGFVDLSSWLLKLVEFLGRQFLDLAGSGLLAGGGGC